MSHDKQLTDLLKRDPIEIAEKIREESGYKADFDALALLLQMGKSQQVNAALEQRDDTKLTNKLDRYIRIIKELGFVEVLNVPFTGSGWGDEATVQEYQKFFAHADGMLLIFDTFNGDGVNSAKVYYAHKPNDYRADRDAYSSGGFDTISGVWPESRHDRNPDDMYWFGDHDAREALRYKIQGLREAGQFLNPWPTPKRGNRWVWACHYMDLKELQYRDPEYQQRIEDARKRLDMLPAWVKEMINIDTLKA